MTELKSKYSAPVERALITFFLVGLFVVIWVLFIKVIDLDCVHYLVGDSYLARKAFVTLLLLSFVFFCYRPLLTSVLYQQQKK